MKIPIGVNGRILNSTHKDHFVRVDDDSENSGGFLIYERWEKSDGPNAGGGFDNWVENSDALSQFFAEAQWAVQWEPDLQRATPDSNT